MNVQVVELRGVTKRYGEATVVRAVDLACREGEVIGLVGHNGAGKSTLFKIMLGIIAADDGDVRLFGEPVRGHRFRDVRRAMGYLPEHVSLYDNLSGLETLRFFARLKSVDASICESLLQRVGLGAAMRRAVREYSKGMRQRLGFAQALLGTPRLLLLDEPTNGLDPEAIHAFYDVLKQLKDDGTTIILSSHLLAEIQARVDRLAIMASGRMVAQGPVSDLTAAADLPAELLITLPGDTHEEARRAWRDAGFVPADRDNGLSVSVPSGRRLQALEVLAGTAGSMTDYRMVEPTLEDVFLQHQRAAAAREHSA